MYKRNRQTGYQVLLTRNRRGQQTTGQHSLINPSSSQLLLWPLGPVSLSVCLVFWCLFCFDLLSPSRSLLPDPVISSSPSLGLLSATAPAVTQVLNSPEHGPWCHHLWSGARPCASSRVPHLKERPSQNPGVWGPHRSYLTSLGPVVWALLLLRSSLHPDVLQAGGCPVLPGYIRASVYS